MTGDERAFTRRRLVAEVAALAATTACANSGAPNPDTGSEPPGYPGAQWVPADITNYTPANRPSSHPVQLVIVHVTQETFPDTLMLFGRPGYRASAHYTVRSQDGHVAQCVREHDVAWHAGMPGTTGAASAWSTRGGSTSPAGSPMRSTPGPRP